MKRPIVTSAVLMMLCISSCTHSLGHFAPVPVEHGAFGSKPGLESIKAGALRTLWVGEAFQNACEATAIPFFWAGPDAARTAGVAIVKPFRIGYHAVVGPLEFLYGCVSWPVVAILYGTGEANAESPKVQQRYDHNWLLRFERDNPNATLDEKMKEAEKDHFIYEED